MSSMCTHMPHARHVHTVHTSCTLVHTAVVVCLRLSLRVRVGSSKERLKLHPSVPLVHRPQNVIYYTIFFSSGCCLMLEILPPPDFFASRIILVQIDVCCGGLVSKQPAR